jgi:hypothetical protein
VDCSGTLGPPNGENESGEGTLESLFAGAHRSDAARGGDATVAPDAAAAARFETGGGVMMF